MAWSRLDDTWYDHPKLMLLPDRIRNEAAGLRDRTLSWSNRHLADGHIPNAVLKTLNCSPSLRAAMLGVGLFEEEPGGVYIHDYPEFNETKAELLERRSKAAEAGRLGGLAKKRNAKRPPSTEPSDTGSDEVAGASDSPPHPLDAAATNARPRNAPAIAPPPGRNARPGPSPIPSPESSSVDSEAHSAVHRADEIAEVFS